MFVNNNYLIHQLTKENNYVSYRGSILDHAIIYRDRENTHRNLFNDYFSDNPVYGEREFHHRFRMSQRLFLHIFDAFKQYDNYFTQ